MAKYSPKRRASSISSTDARVWADSYRETPRAAEDYLKTLSTPLADSCLFCSEKVSGDPRDHLFPVSKGGPTVPGNMAYSCAVCNGARSNSYALDYWRSMDPVKRFHKKEKEFLAALELATRPFRDRYPEEYKIAVGIQAGSNSDWLKFCRNVAEYAADGSQFAGVSNREELIQSFVDFYNESKEQRESDLSAYDQLRLRADSFAQNAIIAADNSGGSPKSQKAFRSSIANAALRFEVAVSMDAKKKEQKRQFLTLLGKAVSKSSVTPYRKLLEAQGSAYVHLVEVATDLERSLGRSKSSMNTEKRRDAKVVVQTIMDGKMKKISSGDSELLEFAILHPRTNRYRLFEDFLSDVQGEKVELPRGYSPSERAQVNLDAGRHIL